MTFITPTLPDWSLANTATRLLTGAARDSRAISGLTIRPATRDDFPAMLTIFRKVTATGDTYVLSPEMPIREVHDYWFGAGVESSWVAVEGGRVVGMYRLIANQKGRGSHVANVSIMVDPGVRRKGVGLALGRHFVAEARKVGFLAIQANIVVSTNKAILALTNKLGFTVVGTLPQAFRHKTLGLVDAYVLHRSL